jgi:hypothetical protein
MQRKIDFDIQLKDNLPVADVKVGVAVQIVQNQDSGTWNCTAADKSLGELPANVIASLPSQTLFLAVIRSVKRAADDPGAVSSVQIRISFPPAGKTAVTAAPAASQLPCSHCPNSKHVKDVYFVLVLWHRRTAAATGPG